MFHIVLIALIVVGSFGCWALLGRQPLILSMFLPRTFTFIAGSILFVMGFFAAFAAAYGLRDAGEMLGAFVFGFVGLWLVMVPSAGMRGSPDHEEMLRRLAMMMGLLLGAILASLYIRDPKLMSLVNLALISGGSFLAIRFLRTTN